MFHVEDLVRWQWDATLREGMLASGPSRVHNRRVPGILISRLNLQDMDMTPAHPAKCPRCGSARVAAIIYTLPVADRQLQEDLRAGRAIPARHVPTGNDPRWHCLKCRHEWGHPHGLSGSSTDANELA